MGRVCSACCEDLFFARIIPYALLCRIRQGVSWSPRTLRTASLNLRAEKGRRYFAASSRCSQCNDSGQQDLQILFMSVFASSYQHRPPRTYLSGLLPNTRPKTRHQTHSRASFFEAKVVHNAEQAITKSLGGMPRESFAWRSSIPCLAAYSAAIRCLQSGQLTSMLRAISHTIQIAGPCLLRPIWAIWMRYYT